MEGKERGGSGQAGGKVHGSYFACYIRPQVTFAAHRLPTYVTMYPLT